MRIKLLVSSCFIAVVFLASRCADRGEARWRTMARDSTSRSRRDRTCCTRRVPRSADQECTYLTGKGSVEFCAPSARATRRSRCCAPCSRLVLSGLVLAFVSGVLTYVSPYRRQGTSADARRGEPRGGVQRNGRRADRDAACAQGGRRNSALNGRLWRSPPPGSRWASCCFAAALSTTSTMLKHDVTGAAAARAARPLRRTCYQATFSFVRMWNARRTDEQRRRALRRLMAATPGPNLQRLSPRSRHAIAGWSLRPIIATPRGIRAPMRGVVFYGEVSCLTGASTASHCPVHPVVLPAVTVECSPNTTSGTSSVRLSVIAGGAVSTAVRPLG